jgi:hypothetical protein
MTDGAGSNRGARQAVQLIGKPFVAHPAWGQPVQPGVVRHRGIRDELNDVLDGFVRPAEGMVRRDRAQRRGCVQRERAASIGVRRREQHRDEVAVRYAEHGRTLRLRGIEHGDRVFDLGLEVGEGIHGHGIRCSSSAAIEVDQTGERAEPAKQPGEIGDVPDQVDVVNPRVHEKQVDRSVPDDLVGEVDITVSSEPRLRCLRHDSMILWAGQRSSPRRSATT